jgi:hypothetical protein
MLASQWQIVFAETSAALQKGWIGFRYRGAIPFGGPDDLTRERDASAINEGLQAEVADSLWSQLYLGVESGTEKLAWAERWHIKRQRSRYVQHLAP